MKIWECKIGTLGNPYLPYPSDPPMRQAIRQAYLDITGEEPQFIFSGWGAHLTETEEIIVRGKQ